MSLNQTLMAAGIKDILLFMAPKGAKKPIACCSDFGGGDLATRRRWDHPLRLQLWPRPRRQTRTWSQILLR